MIRQLMDSSESWNGIIAGGITGAIGVSIIYPVFYVKIMLQLDKKVGKTNSTLDVINRTVNEAGVKGLYRGLPVLILGSIPRYAIRFGSFEKLKTLAMDEKGNLPLSSIFLCGLGAGICEAVLVVTPAETISVKFIDGTRLEKQKYNGVIHGVKSIIAKEGISGCYKGLTATIAREAMSKSIRFFGLEALKDLYRGEDSSIPVPKLYVGVFGGIAGACSVVVNNPVDVVKTRMQSLEASNYKNTADCIKQVMVNEGYKAFWKGTLPRIKAASLEVGITFVIYERIMELLQKM